MAGHPAPPYSSGSQTGELRYQLSPNGGPPLPPVGHRSRPRGPTSSTGRSIRRERCSKMRPCTISPPSKSSSAAPQLGNGCSPTSPTAHRQSGGHCRLPSLCLAARRNKRRSGSNRRFTGQRSADLSRATRWSGRDRRSGASAPAARCRACGCVGLGTSGGRRGCGWSPGRAGSGIRLWQATR